MCGLWNGGRHAKLVYRCCSGIAMFMKSLAAIMSLGSLLPTWEPRGPILFPALPAGDVGSHAMGTKLGASDWQLLTRLLATVSGSLLGKPSLPPARIGPNLALIGFTTSIPSPEGCRRLFRQHRQHHRSCASREVKGCPAILNLNHTCSFWQSIKAALLVL